MIYEFLYRGPVAAENREEAWHVILAEEVTAFGEKKMHTRGPLTPAQAAALGFTLDKIVGEIAATAMAAADTAKTEAQAAKAEVETAKADWTEMAQKLTNAEKVRDEAVKVANAIAIAHGEVSEANAALIAQLAAAQEPDTGPSNPVLNKLTFGLAGN